MNSTLPGYLKATQVQQWDPSLVRLPRMGSQHQSAGSGVKKVSNGFLSFSLISCPYYVAVESIYNTVTVVSVQLHDSGMMYLGVICILS